MVQTLFFDLDKNRKNMLGKYSAEIERGDVIWSHLLKEEDKVIEAVLSEIGQSESFQQDLIEEQRPRLTKFRNFAVLVLSFPTEKTLSSKEKNLNMVQVSFILMKNKIISITEKDVPFINAIMKRQIKKKHKIEMEYLLSSIIDELSEKSIREISNYDFEIEKIEKRIIAGDKASFQEAQLMKENLFYVIKTMKSNAEAVRILENERMQFFDSTKVNRNLKHRIMFGSDLVEVDKENLGNLTSVYLSTLSHRLNENIHKLTIIGAILLIPTIISGLFGMNVDLPAISFWEIVSICFFLSSALLVFFYFKKWV